MKPLKNTIILLFISFCLVFCGCQPDIGRNAASVTGQDQNFTVGPVSGTTALPEKTVASNGIDLEDEIKNELGNDEELLYLADDCYYIVKERTYDPDTDALEAKRETHSQIYKIDLKSAARTLVYEEPYRNYVFKVVTGTDKWVYLEIDGGRPGRESYPVGIARIDRNKDTLDIITDQIDPDITPFAYGLTVFDGIGYFLLHDLESADEEYCLSGIYQLDLETSAMKRLSRIPDMRADPTNIKGMVVDVKGAILDVDDGILHLKWLGKAYANSGIYKLDIVSGAIEKDILASYDDTLFQEGNICYVVNIIDYINPLNADKDVGPYITHSAIYKVDSAGGKRTLVYEEPFYNDNYYFVYATDKWIYLGIWGWEAGSESFPIGFARIDRSADKLNIITDELDLSQGIMADGMKIDGDKGYFFLYSSEDLAGIYQIDFATSVLRKIAPLPDNNVSAVYEGGRIIEIKEGIIYFSWDGPGIDDDNLSYALAISTGVLEKLSE